MTIAKSITRPDDNIAERGALDHAVAPLQPKSLLEGGRIPSLDGLRAISIAMVLGEHAINAVYRPVAKHDYEGPWKAVFNGGLGVGVFFTISGFLITLLLLRESKQTGRISLIDFYIRRAFRIWPAFYVYIGTIVVLAKLGYIGIGKRDILAACFFVFNYVPHVGSWWVGHTWSLSVEEQFYFFWPALLFVCGRKRAAIAAFALLALVPMVRVGELLLLNPKSEWIERMWMMGHTRMDSLMFGCAAALLYGHVRFQRMLDSAFRFGLPWVALLYLFVAPSLVLRHIHSVYYQNGIGYTLDSACVALLILWAVQHAKSLPGKVLNSKLLVHLGMISYSLYLWQQMFLNMFNKSWTGQFPLNLLCALIAAEISFFAIERPFLRLRQTLFHRTP
jgi:peptidoglycan/LPS O-acetylase OafA/YrhL